ncbi:hypothetical protein RhiirA4_449575, partial [Rhizophagus irregularis]
MIIFKHHPDAIMECQRYQVYLKKIDLLNPMSTKTSFESLGNNRKKNKDRLIKGKLWNFNENDDERSLDENDGERNIDEFETDDNLFNDQESKLPNYNEPIFICDYPTSSIIELIYYEANGKQHERSYNILSLGNYPSNVKYTQRSKKNSPVYKIP